MDPGDDDYHDDLGRGPIPPTEFEHVLRQVRHRVAAIQSTQGAQVQLLRRVDEKVSEHHSQINNRIGTLEGRTFGYADDHEGGAIGRLRHSMSTQTRQNWAIIMLLVSTMAGVIATLITHH